MYLVYNLSFIQIRRIEMKKITKKISAFITGTAMCIGLAAAPVSVFAATPEDAAALARSLGIPESFIQAGWNRYYEDPELYPPELIDSYMETLRSMNQEMLDQLISENGGTPSSPSTPSATTSAGQNQQSTTTTAAQSGNGNTSGGNGNTAGGSGNSSNGNSSADDKIILTMPDGSTFERISAKEFAAMTLDEKRAYIATFTPEQQQVFLANLSPEDYKSLMKQLPIENKAEIIDEMAGITEQLGLTLSVDELTDNDIVLSMKDKDGKLVAVNAARDSVASTGYDRRGILAVALSLVTVGIAGAVVAVRKSFRKNAENEE